LVERPDFKGKPVLVVEDCSINRMIAEEFLTAAGAKVLLATNGQEALELLNRVGAQKVACVLMDMQMPVMNGLDATRRIRADARFTSLPVIAMTANAGAEDRERCRAAGMNDFVSKPVSPLSFYQTLSRYLAHPMPSPAAWAVLDAGPIPGHPLADGPGEADCAEPLIDLRVLSDLLRGHPEKVRHYAFRFIDTARQNVHDIQRALDKRDWDAIVMLGHRSKSSARMVGAFRFATLCERLETMATPQREQEAPPIVGRLQSMLDEIRQDAEQRLGIHALL
jgi:CheY-like chemotaxis protein/HPt (histidine-containing phosphotransfer) domain-containing protein